MTRKKYNVQFDKDKEKWEAKLEGGKRASYTATTKKEVEDKAIELAKKAKLGQVKTKGKDGKIQSERTYGKDPFPPKG